MSAQPAPRRASVPLVVVGVVVVVLGFASTLLVGGALNRPSAAGTGTQPVLVAARDLAARRMLTADDLAVVKYSSADVPPGAIATTAAAVGMVVRTPVLKGQAVLQNLISKDASAVDSTAIQAAFLPLSAGTVAVTLPTAEQQGVAGYIQAGDYIDIVAVVTPKGSTSANIRTIYAGVHVIRIGPAVDPVPGAATPGQRSGGITSSLTVAVTQCQAEYLNWFVANAALKYTLLSYLDYQPAPAVADPSCPPAGSVRGVVEADIRARWPALD